MAGISLESFWPLHSKHAGPALVFAVLSLPCAVAVRAQLQRHVQRRRVQRHLHPPHVLGPQFSLAVEALLLCPLVLLPRSDSRPMRLGCTERHGFCRCHLCAKIKVSITAAIITSAMMAAGALLNVHAVKNPKAVARPCLRIRS